MEQNFQTSFIPRKSMVKERAAMPRSVSFLTVISIFVLFTVLVGTGGLFFYQKVLNSKIDTLKNSLTLTQDESELAKISDIQTLNNRLIAANDILSKHIAVTPIFKALEKLTMKTVRFSSFSYEMPTDGGNKISVKMTGIAIGYRSVALQADLFAKNKNFTDPVFSNLQLDDKGNVAFDLTFQVDPNFVNYKQTVETESGQEL